VPIIGSLPVIGKAFQSHVTQVQRKNVVFFVSVRVIDPSGGNVNQAAATASGR
jgi:general secretion pathway protein D